MARFQQGKPKTGGRTKGTKNKTTEQIRQAYQKVLSSKVDELAADLQTMSPFQQWMILDKLSNKVLPNLAKNDDSVEHLGEIKINVTYSDLFNSPDDTEIDDEV